MDHPTRIKVGPHTYRVTASQAALDAAVRKEQADLFGYTDFGRQTITIAPDITQPKQQEVLLHEALHCITDLVGITAELGASDDEKYVNRIAPAILDMLRRNPAFVDYLLA